VLDTFYISEFKAFERVEVKDLKRVNLFVGSNNAGKSCLLEAVRLWNANGAPSAIRDLVRSHDVDTTSGRKRTRAREDYSEPEDLFVEAETEDPVRFLFHDFHYKNGRTKTIELGPREKEEQVSISLGNYRTVRSEEGVTRRIKVEESMFQEFETESQLMLEINLGTSRRVLYSADNLWLRRVPLRPNILDDMPPRPLTVVGTSGVSSAQVAQLWDRVSLTPDQENVLECLRLIDRDITGLALVADAERYPTSERVPVVSLRNRPGRFPLKTMGDGVSRLFHIALSIVNSRNGTMLIDEFENGLYWEVQDELWPIVFKLAEKFDVQVFATSHSTDCVRSFLKTAQRMSSSGALYRVEKFGDSTKVLSLPLQNATDAIASQIEIR
jgi:AAA15 family ATPase/GTPase